MKAIVSGRAGVALLLEENLVASLRVGSGNVVTPCRLDDFHLLFGDAGDLQFLEGANLAQIADCLAIESAKELSLQLALVSLDYNFSSKTRRSAVEELEILFAQEAVADFVNNVLHARPLPERTVIPEALDCAPKHAERFRLLIESLWRNQVHIATVYKAWTVIPVRYFQSEGERLRLQTALVRSGVFRELVTLTAQGHVVESATADRWERSLAVALDAQGVRSIIGEWLTILDEEGDHSLGAPPVNDIDKEPQATKQHATDPAAIEKEIQIQYERVRINRLLAESNSRAINGLDREFRNLRKLQEIEAREMSRRWKSKVPLSEKKLSEALATAEKVLHA